MNKSVSKTLHTYIMSNFTIYFTRNVIFHFQLLSSTTFWLCAMSTWVVRATSCQKFAGNRLSPGNKYFVSMYRKIASSNTSCLEAHVGFFKLLMKGIFGPYVL